MGALAAPAAWAGLHAHEQQGSVGGDTERVEEARGLAHGITPISGALGLVDVELRGTLDVIEGEGVEVRALAPGAGAPLATALLFPDARDSARRSARLMTGQPSFRLEARWMAAGGLRQVDLGEVSAEPPEHERTPDWAKGRVWYQVFVERFRNGDPGNDPAGPLEHTRAWNEPWNSLSADELEQAWAQTRATPARAARPLRFSPAAWARSARRYGGDLPGLAQALPGLRELGVEGLYLCPIFEAPSSHKYDASDFRHIDPTFAPATGGGRAAERAAVRESPDPKTWTRTPADAYFQDEFLPAVHDAGMRIILDGVWNHVGVRHWAFADVVERGAASPFAAWFDAQFATGDPERDGVPPGAAALEPGALIGWRGWNRRNGELPVFARGADDLVAPVREHVFAVTRRWMNPEGPRERRIDGWRLDVAPDLPMGFWRSWRALVKSIDPEALLIGEVWFPARSFFGGAAFDGQMNYPAAMPIVRFIAGDPDMPGAELALALERVFSNHPATDLVQLNLLGSHDTARLATMMHDPGSAYEPAPWFQTPVDRHARPGPEAYRRALLGFALQATMPGAPMVYYGDEVGVFGPTDPHCRKPYPWPELGPYAEGHGPDLAFRSEVKAWLRLRAHPVAGHAVRFGNLRFEPSEGREVLAFRRGLNRVEVLSVVNRGGKEFDASSLRCWGAGWRAAMPEGEGKVVPPLSGRVWYREWPVNLGKPE